MILRLEKVDPARKQRRYYALSVCPTLFGEWSVLREWGRLGHQGGRIMLDSHPSEDAAQAALSAWKRQKERRGYVSRGVQMDLPLGR